MISRRSVLALPLLAATRDRVETVLGPVPAALLGTTLTHEHVLVDFIGADQVNPSRYVRAEVVKAALPKLVELKKHGCRTLVECTPDYLGRDPLLLRELSQKSGLHLLTNTGYYGAANDKFVPKHAYAETAEQLAARWTVEAQKGIAGTDVRPAFMKLGVDGARLSEIDRKIVRAGAMCHQRTGLRMHVHTGPGIAAMDCIEEIRRAGVHPSAYVWVHAQAERDLTMHVEAARAGAWVSLDGVGPKSQEAHVRAVLNLREQGLLSQVLISQDSGWYRVGEPGGGQFNGYTFLFETFLPALRAQGASDADIKRLLVDNPARVFGRAA